MKIAIIGYGKMGREIEKCAIKKGHEISLKINSKNIGDLNKKNISNIDIAIEFSTPKHAFNNILFCLNNKTPIVSGTTGWLKKISEAKKICKQKNGAFLYAPNFSIGVNIFFEINNYISRLMKNKNYDIYIEEKHHILKKDTPSGTAIKIMNDIYENTYGELMNMHLNNSNKIPIKSKRIGNLKGEHIVKYVSDIEEIKISHKSYNRRGFAEGAILAAEFLKNNKGFFTMKSVINNL